MRLTALIILIVGIALIVLSGLGVGVTLAGGVERAQIDGDPLRLAWALVRYLFLLGLPTAAALFWSGAVLSGVGAALLVRGRS